MRVLFFITYVIDEGVILRYWCDRIKQCNSSSRICIPYNYHHNKEKMCAYDHGAMTFFSKHML